MALLIMLGIGSLVYNQYLVEKVLEQEAKSVEWLASAIEYNASPTSEQAGTKLLNAARMLRTNPNVPDSVVNMIYEAESARSSTDFTTRFIIDEDFKIPAIVVTEDDQIIHHKNIDPKRLQTEESRIELLREFRSLNPPIRIVLGGTQAELVQYVYYGESPTVQLLRYFPYIQILLLSLLLGVGYTTYQTITRSEQSNLWVGMAKEAAHQLGTPISSLYGWIQLLKDEYRYDETASNIASEIEKDIQRLKGVAERFGKIGSEPELKPMRVQSILELVVNYMERRLPSRSKHIKVEKSLEAEAMVRVNPELFQWAIENLVKNAMDALNTTGEEEAFIRITSKVEEGEVIIDIEDSGAGIDIKNVKNIFKPGFSTKKRGWGLGLSLTKRIIEDYHDGQIFVLRSELGEGTTMRVILKPVKAEIRKEDKLLADQSPV